MKKFIVICVGLLGLLNLNSCDIWYKDHKLTDIAMQRVETDDSVQNGKVIYLLTPTFEGHDWELKSIFTQPAGGSRGSYETIDSIIVNDVNGNCMNHSIRGMDFGTWNSNERAPFNILLSFANDAEREIISAYSLENLNTIKDKFMYGGPGILSSYLLYVEEGQPLPDSIIVEFAHRKLKAKVNNIPKKIKIG